MLCYVTLETTDGWAYSERERAFTFAKNRYISITQRWFDRLP